MERNEDNNRRAWVARAAACLAGPLALLAVAPAAAEENPARGIEQACPDALPETGFDDAEGATFDFEIDCVVWWEVAQGTGTGFAPNDTVNRAQMASFIANLIDASGGELPEAEDTGFDDISGSVHADNIGRLAAAGIVQGIDDTTYGAGQDVTRGQMASFLARAWEYRVGAPLPTGEITFEDAADSVHEDNISRIATAGFTGGTASGGYEPSTPVTRGQMSAFLARMLDKLVADGETTRPLLPPKVLSSSDMEHITEERCRALSWEERAVSIDGESFGRAVGCPMGEDAVGHREYDLGRVYQEFTATVGIADDSPSSDERVRFVVYGDGEELERVDTDFGESVDIEVDVTNVLRLRIEIQKLVHSGPNTFGAFAEPTLR